MASAAALISFFLLACSSPAKAQNYVAEVLVSKAKGDRLKGLILKPRVVVEVQDSDGEKVGVARIEGELKNKSLSLYLDEERIVEAGESRRDFKVEFPLKGRITPLPLVAENSKGKRKNIKAIVRFKEHAIFGVGAKPTESKPTRSARSGSRLNISTSFGLTTVSYSETPTSGTATEAAFLGLSGKLAANYFLSPPNWDIGVNTYMTLLPLSTTFTSAGTGVTSTTTARFLGINGRLGYRVGFARSRVSLRIMLGWYYTTMLVSDFTTATAPFGFQNMAGPQLFPVMSYRVGSTGVLMGYAKYSPIVGVFSLTDRELAAGAGYIHELSRGKTNLSFNFDYANIGFVLPGEGTVNSTALTFSVGFGVML